MVSVLTQGQAVHAGAERHHGRDGWREAGDVARPGFHRLRREIRRERRRCARLSGLGAGQAMRTESRAAECGCRGSWPEGESQRAAPGNGQNEGRTAFLLAIRPRTRHDAAFAGQSLPVRCKIFAKVGQICRDVLNLIYNFVDFELTAIL